MHVIVYDMLERPGGVSHRICDFHELHPTAGEHAEFFLRETCAILQIFEVVDVDGHGYDIVVDGIVQILVWWVQEVDFGPMVEPSNVTPNVIICQMA